MFAPAIQRVLQAQQFIIGDSARQGKPQARATCRYCRRPHSPHRKSLGLQMLRGAQSVLILSDDPWNNLGIACSWVPAPLTQAPSKPERSSEQAFSLPVHRSGEPQRRPDLLCHVRRHRRAENKCPRVVDEMLLQRGAPANKCAGARKRLPARVYRGGKMFRDFVPDRNPAPCGSLYPGRVRFVHNNTSAVAFCNFHYLSNRSNITFHAKNTLGNNEFATALVRMFL